MTHFEEVEDWNEWISSLHERERVALAELRPEQLGITWGSHYMLPDAQSLLFIFGYCHTEAELRQEEAAAGADAEELDYTVRTIRDAHLRGYRYGKAYSVACVEGEYGSNHVSRMWPITPLQFSEAMVADWDPMAILASGGRWLRTSLLDMAHAMTSRKDSSDGRPGEEG